MNTKNDYIKLAQLHSWTKNTSFAWAKKYLLDRRPPPLSVHPRMRAVQYVAAETKRKSDPEAKRARHDAAFRRNWLRRTNRAIAALVTPTLATLGDITAAADIRAASAEKINELVALKTIALGKRIPAPEITKIAAVVEVRGFSAEFARKMGVKDINMYGNDAYIISCLGRSHGDYSAGKTTWRHGRPVYSTPACHDHYVRSFARIRAHDPRTIDYAFHTAEIALTLPEQYSWGIDANGLRAVCGADDYHPSAPELLAQTAVDNIVANIAKNAATRKQMAAEALAHAAEMEGVYVCVADSVRAGNCLQGTRNFAARHNLDIGRHYSAPDILAHSNGDESRVRLAIRAAITRHHTDMERGYSILVDHTFPAS